MSNKWNKNIKNGNIQTYNSPQGQKRNLYQRYKTCSVCGAELLRPSIHICDSCAKFLREKRVADL